MRDGFEIEAEEDQRRQGEDDAGGDGLAGVAGGLDDVVFEDAGAAEGAEDGDGEDGDRNGGGDGETGAEADVDGDGAEEDAEDGAEEEGADGELGARFGGGDKGSEGGLGVVWMLPCGASPRLLELVSASMECISGDVRSVYDSSQRGCRLLGSYGPFALPGPPTNCRVGIR